MPSDDVRKALEDALSGRASSFHAAVAGTVDQIRSHVEASRAPASGRGTPLGAELGAFAAGRIDAEWLAGLAAPPAPRDDAALPVLERALEALTAVGRQGEGAVRVEVPPGRPLRDALADALAHVGRAFGAARVAELARAGRYAEAEHGPWLGAFAFARWSRAERRMAPPLVVAVDGADLAAGALAEFLDGGAKVVLEVRPPCAPAPLARLVTPGTLVLQTADAWGLDRVAAHDGPCVAALVPEGAALFLHDPGRGAGARARLEVRHRPAEAPRHAVGGWSAWQQGEDLAVLQALAEHAAAAPAPTVDRLASWLLQQADLSNLPA